MVSPHANIIPNKLLCASGSKYDTIVNNGGVFMHVLDIFVLVVMLFCIFQGYRKGFLYKLIELVSLVVSVILAWNLRKPMSKIFNFSFLFQFDLGHEILNGAVTMLFTHIICFVILFVVFQILFIVLKVMSKMFKKVPIVSGVNAIAGALLGALQGFLVLCLVCIGLSLSVDNQAHIEASTLRYVKMVEEPIFEFMQNDIERFAVTMDSLSKGNKLSDEQKETIYQWLLELQIEEGTAENILNTLR